MLQAGGSARDVEVAGQIAALAPRIAKNVGTLAASDDADPDVAAALNKDVGTLRDAQAAMARSADALRQPGTKGDEARATVAELAKRAQQIEVGVATVVANASRLAVAKQSARVIGGEGESSRVVLNDDVVVREAGMKFEAARFRAQRSSSPRWRSRCFVGQGLVRRHARPCERQREREQAQPGSDPAAVEEWAAVADGDLTVQASVTEDVTGAIARFDQFHDRGVAHAREGHQLSATDRVTKATQETQAISNRLFGRRSGRTRRSSRRPRRC